MAAPLPEFIDMVVRAHDLVVTHTGDHFWRLAPRASARAWYVDLDDGTRRSWDDPDRASSVSWVCPALRRSSRVTAADLEVRRLGAQSDLGRWVARFGRLAGRPSKATAGGGADGTYLYTDPHGILDPPLRERIEHWPQAWHDGVVRPAELWMIRVTGEGLVVHSSSWWGSVPAFDHQIALAVDVADRLAALG